MRIGIDVMGGDHAPGAILAGSLDAVKFLAPEDRLVLVGDEQVIRASLKERALDADARLEVVATTQVIGMAEPPVSALREKPDSSIVRLAALGGVKHSGSHRCDIVISAGSTGAMVAAAQMSMRRLPGVHRPGIAVTIPTFAGPVVLCDVGANPEPKPSHLHQYGHMAAIYAEKLLNIQNPKVALMSIGEEEGKGNSLVKEAAKSMKEDAALNYVGHVEGRELFNGVANVIVTEGFTGNVVLKLAEGLSSGIFKTIFRELMAAAPDMTQRFQGIVKSIYAKHDYHEYGGAPLLGANGICVICHGSSEARTITNAIRNSMNHARLGVNEAIVERFSKLDAVQEGAA